MILISCTRKDRFDAADRLVKQHYSKLLVKQNWKSFMQLLKFFKYIGSFGVNLL